MMSQLLDLQPIYTPHHIWLALILIKMTLLPLWSSAVDHFQDDFDLSGTMVLAGIATTAAYKYLYIICRYSIFKHIYYCVHIIFSWLSQNFWMVVCSSGASSPWRPELPKERKSLDRSRISNCSWIEQKYKYFRSVHTSLNFRQIYILHDQLRLKQ